MSKKFMVIITLSAIVGISAICGYIYFNSNKDIISYTATIAEESENIPQTEGSEISKYFVKDKEQIKIGQLIAEEKIKTESEKCEPSGKITTQKEKAEEDYQDAAMMYKDGVISKEQYDESLEDYISTKKEISKEINCKNDSFSIKKVYATADGIISIDEKHTALAVIKPETQHINAYFSPNQSKKIKIGTQAEVTVIKYPEKIFTATVEELGKTNLKGQFIKLKINEKTSDLNIFDNDNVIVKIIK